MSDNILSNTVTLTGDRDLARRLPLFDMCLLLSLAGVLTAIGFRRPEVLALAAPFVVVTLLIYVGMGVLTRLMPQVQVFLLALPLQILIAILLLTMVVSTLLYYWAGRYEEAMVFFLSNAG